MADKQLDKFGDGNWHTLGDLRAWYRQRYPNTALFEEQGAPALSSLDDVSKWLASLPLVLQTGDADRRVREIVRQEEGKRGTVTAIKGTVAFVEDESDDPPVEYVDLMFEFSGRWYLPIKLALRAPS